MEVVVIRRVLVIAAILCCFLVLGVGLAEESAEEVTVEFAQGMDEDELAGGYIQSVMPGRRLLRAARPSGLINLKGANRNLYIALRTRISEVASGEESSTAFEIPASEVFEQWEFTAEELGVNELGMLYEPEEDEEEEGGFAFYMSTGTAFSAKLAELMSEIDFSQVMACLMADCPYDLYWFNKSYTVPTNDFDKQISEDYTKAEIAGNYRVTLLVSPDYAVGTISEDGSVSYSRKEVDTTYGESVRLAAENAQEIMSLNKGKSDYEKLCGYRDAICSLADYNHEVNKDTPYGDPWQLVWVFDGKPNTKVVCEGYAKAFQYLCDLGTESAVAISVQGRIEAGPHMWNLVTIGKRNYLVDLTNYDIGYALFLKGYADGNVADGYSVSYGNGTIRYTYSKELNGRTDRELTLSPWDYSKVRMAGEAVLPEGIEEIGDEAFEGAMIRSVRVPAGCRRIGERAFADSMLEEVYLESNETEIADNAFEGIEEYVTVHGK